MAKLEKEYPWLDVYLMALPGAEKDYKEEWEATRYMLHGKMFAMLGGDKEENPIVTLKLEPSHGELLRKEYEAIVPGYYMNKQHWNSVYLEKSVPREVVFDMAKESHSLILMSLPKKMQKEIMDAQ